MSPSSIVTDSNKKTIELTENQLLTLRIAVLHYVEFVRNGLDANEAAGDEGIAEFWRDRLRLAMDAGRVLQAASL